MRASPGGSSVGGGPPPCGGGVPSAVRGGGVRGARAQRGRRRKRAAHWGPEPPGRSKAGPTRSRTSVEEERIGTSCEVVVRPSSWFVLNTTAKRCELEQSLNRLVEQAPLHPGFLYAQRSCCALAMILARQTGVQPGRAS